MLSLHREWGEGSGIADCWRVFEASSAGAGRANVNGGAVVCRSLGEFVEHNPFVSNVLFEFVARGFRAGDVVAFGPGNDLDV